MWGAGCVSVCMICVVYLVSVYGITRNSICDMAWFVACVGVFVGICCDVFGMYVCMVSVSDLALICVIYMIWYVCMLCALYGKMCDVCGVSGIHTM